MCQGLNSHYLHIIGDGHQPNSRGLYTHYKDSVIKGGRSRLSPKKTRQPNDHGTHQESWVDESPRLRGCFFEIICGSGHGFFSELHKTKSSSRRSDLFPFSKKGQARKVGTQTEEV